MWRGGLGGPINSRSVLRFHIPLIEPDLRISRIRLSDKDSCVRPRKVARLHFQPGQAQTTVEGLVREA